MISPVLGNVIKNAVKVNELNVREKFSGKGQKDENINAKFVYLGAAAYGNEILPVRIQIDQRNGFKKIESYDVLKSFNTKIGRIASQNKNAPLGVSISPNAPATISIANLIGIAQPLHPQIFSRDVANALGVPYRGNEIQAKFSVGNRRSYSQPSLFDQIYQQTFDFNRQAEQPRQQELNLAAENTKPTSANAKPLINTGKIEDVGEKISGARKDILKNYVAAIDDATREQLYALPFSKAFKRPDLVKAVQTGTVVKGLQN